MIIEPIKEKFSTAISIRQDLNNVLWKRYDDLGKVFGFLFGQKAHALKKVSDANYYKGGWPFETSPSKIESICQSIGIIGLFFNEIGRLEELNLQLAKYGFQLTPTSFKKGLTITDPSTITKKAITKAFDRVKRIYPDFDYNKPVDELIEWFLDKTFDLQKEICEKADEIKNRIFGEVAHQLNGVNQAGFVSGVNIAAAKKTKLEKRKSIDSLKDATATRVSTLKKNANFIDEAVK